MSMIDAYAVDEITILKYLGRDSWGEPISGSSGEDDSVDVRGYVEYKTKLVRNNRGEERISEVMIYLSLQIERQLGRKLSHEDRIQLGGESFDRAIIDIRRPKDFSHPHLEIYLA